MSEKQGGQPPTNGVAAFVVVEVKGKGGPARPKE